MQFTQKYSFLVLVSLFGFLPIAQAGFQVDHYEFQARTNNYSSGEMFWQNFFRSISGQAPLPNADVNIIVKDAKTGAVLSGATVLLGSEEGKPFAGNKKTTDAAGLASFSAQELKSKPLLSVTAKKAGYAALTILSTNANSIELALQADPVETAYAYLRGKINGWPAGYGSRTIEMGAFLPAFRAESLLNFDPQQIVSSYKVIVKIYGDRKIPGNIVFPPQDKTYMIFPVHLEKPEFIMPLPLGMNVHMSGTIGAAPLGDTMDAVKGKDFLEALNLSTLTHTSWTPNQVLVNGDQNFDLNATQELTQKAITSSYKNIPKGLDTVAISLIDPTGDKGDYIPLDVKSLKSADAKNGSGAIQVSKLKQNASPASQYYVFSAIFDQSQFIEKANDDGVNLGGSMKRALAGGIQKLDASLSTTNNGFFKLMQTQPASSNARNYSFSSPNNVAAGIQANLILLNVYSEKNNDLTQGRSRHLIWSTILPGSATQLSLPLVDALPVLPAPDAAKKEKFFWEVIAVKGGSSTEQLNTKAVLENLEQLSNAVEVF